MKYQNIVLPIMSPQLLFQLVLSDKQSRVELYLGFRNIVQSSFILINYLSSYGVFCPFIYTL